MNKRTAICLSMFLVSASALCEPTHGKEQFARPAILTPSKTDPDKPEDPRLKREEDLRTSMQFEIVAEQGSPTTGYASLIGYKRVDKQCTYVFLTAGHVISSFGNDKTFSELRLHSYLLRKPIKEFKYIIHPEVSLVYGDKPEHRNDLALFTFKADCLAVDPKPFRLMQSDKLMGEAFATSASRFNEHSIESMTEWESRPFLSYEEIDNLPKGNWPPPLITLHPELKFKTKAFGNTEGEYQLEKKDAQAKNPNLGRSGLGIFVDEEGKPSLGGCFVAAIGDRPNQLGKVSGNYICVMHGGPKLMKWVSSELDKVNDGKDSWPQIRARNNFKFSNQQLPSTGN